MGAWGRTCGRWRAALAGLATLAATGCEYPTAIVGDPYTLTTPLLLDGVIIALAQMPAETPLADGATLTITSIQRDYDSGDDYNSQALGPSDRRAYGAAIELKSDARTYFLNIGIRRSGDGTELIFAGAGDEITEIDSTQLTAMRHAIEGQLQGARSIDLSHVEVSAELIDEWEPRQFVYAAGAAAYGPTREDAIAAQLALVDAAFTAAGESHVEGSTLIELDSARFRVGRLLEIYRRGWFSSLEVQAPPPLTDELVLDQIPSGRATVLVFAGPAENWPEARNRMHAAVRRAGITPSVVMEVNEDHVDGAAGIGQVRRLRYFFHDSDRWPLECLRYCELAPASLPEG